MHVLGAPERYVGEQVLCTRGALLLRAEYRAEQADQEALDLAAAAFDKVVESIEFGQRP